MSDYHEPGHGALGEAAVHSSSTDACLESLNVLGVGSGNLYDDMLEACVGFQAPDMQCVLDCQGHLGFRERVCGGTSHGTSCGIITGRGSRGHIYLGQRIRHSRAVARKGIRRDQHSRDTRTSESLSTPSIHSLPPQPF